MYGIYLNFNLYRKQILTVYRNAWDESWDLPFSLNQISIKGLVLEPVYLGKAVTQKFS